MPVPNLPNIYRTAINQTIGSLPVVNVVYTYKGGSDATTVGDEVATDFAQAFGAIQASDLVYTTYETREQVPTGLAATGPIAVSTSGAGNSVPPGAALVVTWLTTLGGRSYRGRSYIGGVSANYLNGSSSLWDDGSGDLQGAVNDFLAKVAADSQVLQVYSSVINGVTPVIDGLRKLQIGSQRRRNVP